MIISDLMELQANSSFYKIDNTINIFQLGDRNYVVTSGTRAYLLRDIDKSKLEKGLMRLGYKKGII